MMLDLVIKRYHYVHSCNLSLDQDRGCPVERPDVPPQPRPNCLCQQQRHLGGQHQHKTGEEKKFMGPIDHTTIMAYGPTDGHDERGTREV